MLRLTDALVHDLERTAINLTASAASGFHLVERPVGRAHQRLRQISRVVDERHEHQGIALPDEPLGRDRLIAVGRTVSLQVPGLHVRRRHLERVSFPHPGREPGERVRRVFGRVRASVHPDRALAQTEQNVESLHLIGQRVHHLGNLQTRGTAKPINPGVRPALLFGNGEPTRIPTGRSQLAGVVEWQPREITNQKTRAPVPQVFVEEVCPVTVDVGPDRDERHVGGRRSAVRRFLCQRRLPHARAGRAATTVNSSSSHPHSTSDL